MNELELLEILFVEDSDSDAELMLRVLKQHNLANKVTRVKDGQEALDFVFGRGKYASQRGKSPHLILLDLGLPKIDGITVLRALRSDEHTRDIPVIVFTVSAQERDVVESHRLGVTSYLLKPVEFLEFADVVGRAGFRWGLLNRFPG